MEIILSSATPIITGVALSLIDPWLDRRENRNN